MAKQAARMGRLQSGAGRWTFNSDEAITSQISVLSNLFARAFYETVGRHSRININEWRAMLALARHPALSQAEIADYTGLHKMTVSRAIRRLVSSGHVIGRDDAEDGRRRTLFLTPTGRSLCDQALPLLRLREAMLGAGVRAAELKEFRRILARIIANVRAWPDAV